MTVSPAELRGPQGECLNPGKRCACVQACTERTALTFRKSVVRPVLVTETLCGSRKGCRLLAYVAVVLGRCVKDPGQSIGTDPNLETVDLCE